MIRTFSLPLLFLFSGSASASGRPLGIVDFECFEILSILITFLLSFFLSFFDTPTNQEKSSVGFAFFDDIDRVK